MDILKEIIEHKKREVAERKSLYPTKLLEKSIYFGSRTVSLKRYVQRDDKSGIIAEFKRQSPSKGIINAHASVERTSIGYMQAGASALSILTDSKYFGGKNEDLTKARKFNFCPILRKDFTVDEYQIVEAKSIGADAVLLIAAALKPVELHKLAEFAKSLGLETLMEVHTKEELERSINPNIDGVGVNNRNLKTFEVSVDISLNLAEHIPSEFVKISESGIRNPETVLTLKKAGYQGFLMGERFMQSARPQKSCAEFAERLKELNGRHA
ncbi:MAG: indole-3-glycerol phosphate synthase TrpC [Bacteroidota bacterium]